MTRQRIPLPKSSGSNNFYDIIDFNIGKTVDLHGRVFKITNCDNFTRVFLNRLGIAVPDPIAMPADPYTERREQVQFFECLQYRIGLEHKILPVFTNSNIKHTLTHIHIHTPQLPLLLHFL